MPLVGLVRPVRTVEDLDCSGALHPGHGSRLFKYPHPDAATVLGFLGRRRGVGLSGVRPPHPRTDDHYPCAHHDDHYPCAHDDHYPCAHHDDHYPCAHHDDHYPCAHHDDHYDASADTPSDTVSEWDSSEWVWMSCESSSPAVMQGGGVPDVYLPLGWGASDGDGAAVSDDHDHNDYYHHSGDHHHYGGAAGVFERVVEGSGTGVAGFDR